MTGHGSRAAPVPPGALAEAARILVVKLDELGDFVLVTPFLRGLRASAPKAHIALVVTAPVVPLTIGCPWVDSVVTPLGDPASGTLNFKGRTPDELRAFGAAFRAGFDIAVTARYDFDKNGAAALVAASRARIRMGFSESVTPWKAVDNAGFDAAYTHVLPATTPRHEVEHGLALLTALGGRSDGDRVELWLDDASRAAAASLLGAAFPDRGGKAPLMVAHTTESPRRNYPVASFATLVNRVAAALDRPVVLVGAPYGASRGAALMAGLTVPVADMTGRTSVREVAALFEHACAVVALDGGAAHMAAAVGTPVAALFCQPVGADPNGANAPERFAPWGEAVSVIRPDRPVSPCRTDCIAAEPHCVSTIDPVAAADQITGFIKACRNKPIDQNTRAAPSAPKPIPSAAKVHVSFPVPPDAYPVANRHWHAQLSAFVHRALVARFGDRVVFTPWNTMPPLRGADALVTFLPHPALARWKRSVLIENDEFSTDKWRHAAFRRYGLNAPLDDVGQGYRWREGQFGMVVLSNDIAMGKVIAADPFVSEYFAWLRGSVTRLVAYPHPIDKPFFSRHYKANPPPDRARMLVYHGGPRKNSAELIALLERMGFARDVDFSVVGHVAKNDDALLNFLLSKFAIVANTSYSETGPINMIEYLLSGHIVYGHEDWWDGGGNSRLCWTYDPARMDENAAGLDHLLRRMSMDELMAERDRLWNWWMERDDNEWPAVTDALCDQVEELLASRHPAMIRP